MVEGEVLKSASACILRRPTGGIGIMGHPKVIAVSRTITHEAHSTGTTVFRNDLVIGALEIIAAYTPSAFYYRNPICGMARRGAAGVCVFEHPKELITRPVTDQSILITIPIIIGDDIVRTATSRDIITANACSASSFVVPRTVDGIGQQPPPTAYREIDQ